jgi:hypothetical protein
VAKEVQGVDAEVFFRRFLPLCCREETNNMRAFILGLIGNILLIVVLLVPAWSQQANSHTPRPGSINYVEGQASVGAEPLDPNAIGSVDLAKDQFLTTQAGKVEVLLTPGIFLRALITAQ